MHKNLKIFIWYFHLYFCLIGEGLGESGKEFVDHEHFVYHSGQMMLKQFLELEQLARNSVGGSEALIRTIFILRELAKQLVDTIKMKSMYKLADPLIYEHSIKIERFFNNLMIEDGQKSDLTRKILQNGIGNIKERILQVQRLIDMNKIEWTLWPLLYNFRLNQAPINSDIDSLDKKLAEMIERMRLKIKMKNSYYNRKPFDDAIVQLAQLANDKNDRENKLESLFKIVPKLMVEATGEMLHNLTTDIIKMEGAFLGTKFLLEFAAIVNGTENQCHGLLHVSTLAQTEQQLLISRLFDGMKSEANKMFERQIILMSKHFENIRQTLREKMAQIRNDMFKALERHPTKRFKLFNGTPKRHKPLEILKEVQEVFAIVHNSLDMADLQYPSEMLIQKLAQLEHLLRHKTVKNNGTITNEDHEELCEQIMSCLITNDIEERIQTEINNLAYQILF